MLDKSEQETTYHKREPVREDGKGLAVSRGWFVVAHICAWECNTAQVVKLLGGLGGSYG
jgi:hypothetical protein